MTLYRSLKNGDPFDWSDLPSDIRLAILESPWLQDLDVKGYRPLSPLDQHLYFIEFHCLKFQKRWKRDEMHDQLVEKWLHVDFIEDPKPDGSDIYLLRPCDALTKREFVAARNAELYPDQMAQDDIYQDQHEPTHHHPAPAEAKRYPSAEVKVAKFVLEKHYSAGIYQLDILCSIEASLKVTKKHAQSPTTVDQDQFKLEVKTKLDNILRQLTYKNPISVLKPQPDITLSLQGNTYCIKLEGTVISYNEKLFTGSLEKSHELIHDREWHIEGEIGFHIKANLIKKKNDNKDQSLTQDIEQADQELIKLFNYGKEAVIQTVKQKPITISEIIVLAVVFVLLLPVGA